MASGAVATRVRGLTERRTVLVDAAVLAVAALLLRLPAFLSSRDLSYDDGFFGLVAVEMRHGSLPYRDFFMPQSPLHPVLLFGADLLGLRTTNAPRLLPVLAGIVVTIATYAAARQLTSRYGAILAALLVTSSGSVLWVTAGIAADGGAIALSVVALALALRYSSRPTRGWAVATGLCAGAAVATKALAGPVVLPVGLLLLSAPMVAVASSGSCGGGRHSRRLSRTRGRDLVAAGIALLVVPVVTTLAWGPNNVWEQSIQYNRGADRLTSYWGAFTKVVRTLVERDLLLLIVAGLAVVVAVVAHARSAPATDAAPVERPPFVFRPVTILAAWLVAQLAVLIVEPAMWRPHVAHLVVPIALLAVLRPPPLVPVLLAAVLVLPWYYDHVQPMLRPGGFDRVEATAVRALERLPDGALVISDNPGLVWRSGHRIPAEYADSSVKRIEAGQITAPKLLAAARDRDVCAVLVWTDRYRDLELGPRLEREGFTRTSAAGAPYELYERSGCRA